MGKNMRRKGRDKNSYKCLHNSRRQYDMLFPPSSISFQGNIFKSSKTTHHFILLYNLSFNLLKILRMNRLNNIKNKKD